LKTLFYILALFSACTFTREEALYKLFDIPLTKADLLVFFKKAYADKQKGLLCIVE